MKKDWKNFYIKHKWFPSYLLVEKFNIKQYDIDNFKKLLPPEIKMRFKGFSTLMEPEQLNSNLKEAWKYYLNVEKGIDLNSDVQNWAPTILKLSTTEINNDKFSFLIGSKYLQSAFGQQYESFIDKGYTVIAFCCFHLYPGAEIMKKNHIHPAMFHQTKTKVASHLDLVELLDDIYMNFYCDNSIIDSRDEDHKESYIIRYKEVGFFPKSFLSKYNFTDHMTKSQGGILTLKTELKNKYMKETGLHMGTPKRWDRRLFQKENPEIDLDHCFCCKAPSPSLHHLLPRSDYPEYTFHPENVVPLCENVHVKITRNDLTNRQKEQYKQAILLWLNNPDKEHFKQLLNDLHIVTYETAKKIITSNYES